VKKTPAKRASAPAPVVGKASTRAKPSTASSKKAAPIKPAKPAAAAKAHTKPVAPTQAKAASKAPVKAKVKPAPAAKSAPASKPPAKTTSTNATPRVAAPPAPKAAAGLVAPPRPAAATPAPAPTRMSSSAKSKASAKAQAAYAAPAPMPIPTSRFADRFAPPRPPTRQMSHLEVDSPKHTQKFDPKLANAWKSKAGRDLTEAELLAMPDSEYMNEKQLEYFRATLQALKDDLLSNAGETTEHLREDTSIVPDPADRATIEEEHALELRTRDRERKLLKKISQSLTRIESGDYGFCDETGEPIGLGRLLARPTATLSLEAQQRRELKQKMFGD